MLFCLNPECPQPINPDHHKFCQQCSTPLLPLLRNRYKILNVLGKGGFGKTYLAEDTDKLNERCVVKQLIYQAQGTLANKKIVELFMREAQQLQQLKANQQIPDLHGYFEDNHYLYLVQEFVEGQDLLHEFDEQGPFSEAKIRAMLLDILPILQFIHERGIVHRDLKPENIMRRQSDGRLILIDFGVAREVTMSQLSLTGTKVGSPGYSSLEQFNEGKAYSSSDFYSLGATCFHLMTGQFPGQLWTMQGYGWVNKWQEHLPASLSPELTAVMSKMLQVQARDRYQTADAILEDLQQQPISSAPTTASQTASTPKPSLSVSPTTSQTVSSPTPSQQATAPATNTSASKITPQFSSTISPSNTNRRGLVKFLGLVGIGVLGVSLFSVVRNAQKVATSDSSGNSRLQEIISRGQLKCGISGSLPGFSYVDQAGNYVGIDVDICRAISAAIFDDPDKVEYRVLDTRERFTALQSGEIDVLSRNISVTAWRDSAINIAFAPKVFYDGQGLMVSKSSGIQSLKDFQNRSVCIQAGTTYEKNLANQMDKLDINYTPIVFEDVIVAYTAYLEGRCDGFTDDRSQLAARRSTFQQPDKHTILDELMSIEPLAPGVLEGDSQWHAVVTWIVFATIEAEELGLNSRNLEQFTTSNNASVQRFLGNEDNLGEGLGLSNDFAARVIRHVGNYREMYDRNLGSNSDLKLERGLNRLHNQGGLLYSPPFR